jgi:CoA:oxalate CoA-transferase
VSEPHGKPGALAGIRVVDFTQVISGPFTSYQLGCMGADVVKVEQPGGGDQGRGMLAPTPEVAALGMSALFTAVNGGKRSVTLNLKHAGASEVVEALVRNADVVVENFKAGTLERLGYDEARLRAWTPNLVLCRISGFGQSGPRSGAPAYDPVVQAQAGMMSVNGTGEDGPTKVGFWVVDMATGMNAALAITSALLARATPDTHASVHGETLDVAMLDTAISLLSPLVNLQLNYAVSPPYTGNGTPGSGGSSTVYPTRTAHVTVAAATDAQFKALVTALTLPELADDERFAKRAARLKFSAQLRPLLVAAFARETAEHWVAHLAEVGVPGATVQSVGDLETDPQVQHRKQFSELGAAPGLGGSFRAINMGFKRNGESLRPRSPPPSNGADTDAVLTELGFSEKKINDLRAQGIV